MERGSGGDSRQEAGRWPCLTRRSSTCCAGTASRAAAGRPGISCSYGHCGRPRSLSLLRLSRFAGRCCDRESHRYRLRCPAVWLRIRGRGSCRRRRFLARLRGSWRSSVICATWRRRPVCTPPRRGGRALAVFGVPDVGQAVSAGRDPHLAVADRTPRAGSSVRPVGQLHTLGAAPTQR